MADPKVGEPFGLDAAVLAKIDWPRAVQRILADIKTDFIYAPHLAFIFAKAEDELCAEIKKQLGAGTFSPGMPVTMEVPKSFRIKVGANIKRLGPSYSRPGSILPPLDRLFYQALADEAAPIVDVKTDKSRSFSHRLADPKSAEMFVPTRTCWGNLQKALAGYAAGEKVKYILKVDVANYFGSLNQHTMINMLADAGYPKALGSRLEVILTSFTGGERSSRGILQGMFPSDLFGNNYLAGVDRALKEFGVNSARYVDDIFVFVESVDHAEAVMRMLIPTLRTYGLVLNEAKSSIIPKDAIHTEEPDLEALFADAVEEISEQVEEDFSADYGFQSEWDDDEEDEDEGDVTDGLELQATTVLFDAIDKYPGHEENIERFCLPLFSKANSDYALNHVLDSFERRPAMSQLYASYLAKFLGNDDVQEFLVDALSDEAFTDWQRMWILAALSQSPPGKASDESVKAAVKILADASRHDALRAVAAIYVGTFGDHARRLALVALYPTVSSNVQSAIYFASRKWPGVEKANAKASWGNHSSAHKLLTVAMAKK